MNMILPAEENVLKTHKHFSCFWTCFQLINSLPNNNFVDWSQLKAFADNKINVIEKLKFVLQRTENIVGKRGNTAYQHFLLFPQCFQKPSLSGSLKVWIVRYRVKCWQCWPELSSFHFGLSFNQRHLKLVRSITGYQNFHYLSLLLKTAD